MTRGASTAEFELTATVSGSFRRAMPLIQDAVDQLVAVGVKVLSPADPRIVDQFGDFLFVASDRLRVIRLVQDRHLAAIESSRFLWLVAPDGYVGQSAAMEIGYAVARGVPVFASSPPTDLTLRQYVTPATSPVDAVMRLAHSVPDKSPTATSLMLLDPAAGADRAHQQLEVVERRLLSSAAHREDDPDTRTALRDLGATLSSGA